MKDDGGISFLNQKSSYEGGAFEIAANFTNKLNGELALQNPWVTWHRDPKVLGELIYRNRNRKLSGLVIGVKDVISTSEFPTRMGTDRAWSNPNMGFDARVISTCKELGAVIGGKTKTSEFAVHKETDVINPRFPGYTAGTSSAGSAAAVANGTIDLAFATQTAGSIARPASYCGVVGFKPTFGDWPRTGVLKTTDDFDSVGIMGRHPALIKDFYMATRLSGPDYPVLENRRQRKKFNKVVMLVGEPFDSSTEEIANLARRFYETRILPFGYKSINQEEYLFFASIRKAHELIYRHDLMYYFKKEIDSINVSQELVNFIDREHMPNQHEYLEAKLTLNSWKVECQKKLQETLIVTLSASTSAPVSDVAYQKDLNAAITAAGFPQLSIPAFSDPEGRNVNISLSGVKGSDVEILDLGTRILS